MAYKKLDFYTFGSYKANEVLSKIAEEIYTKEDKLGIKMLKVAYSVLNTSFVIMKNINSSSHSSLETVLRYYIENVIYKRLEVINTNGYTDIYSHTRNIINAHLSNTLKNK